MVRVSTSDLIQQNKTPFNISFEQGIIFKERLEVQTIGFIAAIAFTLCLSLCRKYNTSSVLSANHVLGSFVEKKF